MADEMYRRYHSGRYGEEPKKAPKEGLGQAQGVLGSREAYEAYRKRKLMAGEVPVSRAEYAREFRKNAPK